MAVAIQPSSIMSAGANRQSSIPAANEETTSASSSQRPNWALLVAQIQTGEQAALEQLYKVFRTGVRYYLCRQLGLQELEDRVHDTFLIIVKAIQRGDLREPERLMGFVRTVAHRQVAAYIGKAIESRRDETDLKDGVTVADRTQNPEQQAIVRQRAELMQSSLSALSEKDREILVRFYLEEQPQEQICCEMDLTETQYRLLKSRAKFKFGEIGRKKLAGNGTLPAFAKPKAVMEVQSF
jgi:RNA polymerase sigma-70 factor, ECF subfamily